MFTDSAKMNKSSELTQFIEIDRVLMKQLVLFADGAICNDFFKSVNPITKRCANLADRSIASEHHAIGAECF